MNCTVRFWKLFSQSSTCVPALLPCDMLPWQARATHRKHFTKPTVQFTLYLCTFVTTFARLKIFLMVTISASSPDPRCIFCSENLLFLPPPSAACNRIGCYTCARAFWRYPYMTSIWFWHHLTIGPLIVLIYSVKFAHYHSTCTPPPPPSQVGHHMSTAT